MQGFLKDLLNVVFSDMVKHFSSNFDVRTFTACIETMITPEKNLIGKAIMINESLNNFQQVFISPRKTGTAQANYYFPPMVHHFLVLSRKDKKEKIENGKMVIIL